MAAHEDRSHHSILSRHRSGSQVGTGFRMHLFLLESSTLALSGTHAGLRENRPTYLVRSSTCLLQSVVQ